LSLPSGLTAANTVATACGKWIRNIGTVSVFKQGVVLVAAGASTINFGIDDNPTGLGPYTAQNANTVFQSSDAISFAGDVSIQISQWAGSGTVNLGAGSVEYAANSGTWDADVTLSGFVYGPAGVQMGGALTGSRIKRVKFQYPIQSDDEFTLEFSSQANGPFQSAPTFADTSGLNVFPFVFAATAAADPAGCEIRRVSGSTTDLDIVFAKRSWARGDASAYRDWQSTWYWRVRKAKAGAAVGFGMANSNESGLIKPRKGQTALTVTSSAAGWSTIRAVGIYYQDQDGNHRLKFNLAGSFTSKTFTSDSVTISGVTFKNVASFFQPVSAMTTGSTPGSVQQAYANPNSSNINLLTSSGTSISGMQFSGDVELESKPSWA
jgi:hypothetical protein